MLKLEKKNEEYRKTSYLGCYGGENAVIVVEDLDGEEVLAVKDGEEIILLTSYSMDHEILTPEDRDDNGSLYISEDDFLYSKKYIYNNDFCQCFECGHWFDPGYGGVFTEDGYEYCQSCVDYEDVAYCCDDCGRWFSHNYRDGLHGTDTDDNEVFYCEYCMDDYYECSDCGRIIHCDEAVFDDYEVYCQDCYEEHGGDAIYSYHFDGNQTDYGFKYYVKENRQKDPLVSPEWEIDCGGLNGENAREIIDAIGGEDFVLAQKDGSLENGFEIVPAPADLYNHLNVFNWRDGMATALRLGYRAHDPGTCGLHVHIDREFFSDTELSQDRIEDMFWVSLFNNIEWIKKFSRRKDYCYCRITDDTGEKLDTVEKAEEKVKKISKFDRYQAINLSRRDTIEIRIFRGTCNIETFYATLEMVDIWARLIKEAQTIQRAMAITLDDFINEAKKRNYNEFLSYLERLELIDENTGF